MKDDIFDDLKDLQKEMIDLLGQVNSLTTGPSFIPNKNVESYWQPNYDAYEIDNKFVIIVELAGVDKKDINIALSSDYIRISGERKLISDVDGLCYYNLEIETGKFQRTINIRDLPLDLEHYKVSFTNGLLRLEFNIKELEEKIITIE